MLKIGDEVYLSEEGIESWWSPYGASNSNPKSVKGVIHCNGEHSRFDFFVKWSNGIRNAYNKEDLIKVTQEKPVVIGYRRVWSDGSLGKTIMDKLAVSKGIAQKRGSICYHKNGKQKFRPVYEV